jgi:hypothetical protein
MTSKTQDEEENLQGSHLRQREALNNAYAALLSQKCLQSFQAFTFEEALDQQAKRIDGTSTQLRPNELAKVDRIEQQLLAAVTQLQQVPPEQFLAPKPGEDVNSYVNPEMQP